MQQSVAQEWVRLNRDGSIAVLLRRWAARYPAFDGMNRPADIVDAIDAAAPAGKDQLLLCLVELFQSGEQLAGRIAVQAMLPKLSNYAFRTRVVAGIEPRPDDRFQVVLYEFWEVLGRYPVTQRATRVAANLSLDTLHRLTRAKAVLDVPVDPAVISVLTEPLGAAAGRSEPLSLEAVDEPNPDGDLDALLCWAIGRSAISRDDARLLRQVYVGQEPGGTTRDVSQRYREHSASTGTSPAALRQRVRRAKERLAAAVGAAVAAQEDTGPTASGPAATA